MSYPPQKFFEASGRLRDSLHGLSYRKIASGGEDGRKQTRRNGEREKMDDMMWKTNMVQNITEVFLETLTMLLKRGRTQIFALTVQGRMSTCFKCTFIQLLFFSFVPLRT